MHSGRVPHAVPSRCLDDFLGAGSTAFLLSRATSDIYSRRDRRQQDFCAGQTSCRRGRGI
jgi:hypothetical protein